MCVCVRALTTEPFDIWPRNFTCWSTWTISRSSVMVKVKGQGHQVRKCDFLAILLTCFLFDRHHKNVWPMVECHDVM